MRGKGRGDDGWRKGRTTRRTIESATAADEKVDGVEASITLRNGQQQRFLPALHQVSVGLDPETKLLTLYSLVSCNNFSASLQ